MSEDIWVSNNNLRSIWTSLKAILNEKADKSSLGTYVAQCQAILDQITSQGGSISDDLRNLAAEIKVELDEKKAEIESVYQTDLERVEAKASANTERIAELEFSVMDLQSALDGIAEVEFKRETTDGTVSVPTPTKGKLSGGAEVMRVKGHSEAYSEVDLGTLTWTYGSGTWYCSDLESEINKVASNDDVADVTAEKYRTVKSTSVLGTMNSIGIRATGYIWVYNGSDSIKPSGWMRYKGKNTTIHHSTDIAVKSVNANLNDEAFEVGGFVWTTGAEYSASDRIRSKNFIKIESGKTIFAKWLFLPRLNVMLYDANKNFIERKSGLASFTTPTNAKFMRLCLDNTTSYANDVMISYSDIPYEPYKSDTFTAPSDLILKEGDVWHVASGEIEETYGKIDMGSLEWRYIESDDRMQANISQIGMKPLSAKVILPISYSSAISTGDASALRVYGTGYTDASAFKNLVDGKDMVYELATPTTRTVAPISNHISVWAGGSVTVSSEGAQAEAELSFKLNYSVDTRLNDLEAKLAEQTSINKEQSYRIKNLEAVNEGNTYRNVVESTENGILNLPTSGTLAPNGMVGSVMGDTKVWNQLLPSSDMSPQSSSGITMSRSEGKFIVDVNNATASWQSNLGVVNVHSGHVYFLWSDNPLASGMEFYGASWTGVRGTKNAPYNRINRYTARDGYLGNQSIFFWVGNTTPNGHYEFRLMVIDLTIMFGSGNEPSIDDCIKIFTEWKPYSAPVLKDAENIKVESKPVWTVKSATVSGAYLNADGTETPNSSYSISNYMPVFGGSPLFVSVVGEFNNPSICWYDGHKKYIGGEKYARRLSFSVDLPYDAKYVRLSYNDEIADDIHINQESKWIVAIPSEWYSKVPNLGMKGCTIDFDAKTVTWTHDKYTFDRTVTSYGFVSLGTYYRSNIDLGAYISDIENSNNDYIFEYESNFKFSYSEDSRHYYVQSKGMYLFSPVKDNNELKDALDGMTLIYPLATPITKTFAELGLEEIDRFLPVESGGTVRVISDGAQAEAEVGYQVKLGGTV